MYLRGFPFCGSWMHAPHRVYSLQRDPPPPLGGRGHLFDEYTLCGACLHKPQKGTQCWYIHEGEDGGTSATNTPYVARASTSHKRGSRAGTFTRTVASYRPTTFLICVLSGNPVIRTCAGEDGGTSATNTPYVARASASHKRGNRAGTFRTVASYRPTTFLICVLSGNHVLRTYFQCLFFHRNSAASHATPG